MPTPTTKKKVKKIAAEDPLSSSGVSSLSGISSYNIRKISIYKNGDRYHRGVKFVINPRVVKDMEPLLNQINDRIELSHGAKKLYTTDGKVIGSIKELEDGKIYVAASAQFIPMRYGEFAEKVWKPPSRKHSPIMSSDRIKTARTRSQDPGRRRQPQNSGVSSTTQNSGSGVQRSRSVRTLAEDRKSRRDNSNVARNPVNGNAPPKKFDQPRPKAPVPKQTLPKPRRTLPASTTTAKKPPTPKRKISKKVLGAAAGVGVTVVGAAALGAVAAASKKGKPPTPKPKPIPTAVSDISTASSVIPAPNVESSGAAEILEFPEEEKQIDVAMIHRTPTPPKTPSRSASAKSMKKAPETPDRQPTPEASSEEDEGHEEDGDDEDVEDDEEEAGSEEVEEASDEEEEDEEEDEEEEEEGEEDSRNATPASRKSSSAVSSAGSHVDKKKEDAKK